MAVLSKSQHGITQLQQSLPLLIVELIDAEGFDLRLVRKSCVHIAHPDARGLIPFYTYNLFYRDELETTRLGPLRQRAFLAQ